MSGFVAGRCQHICHPYLIENYSMIGFLLLRGILSFLKIGATLADFSSASSQDKKLAFFEAQLKEVIFVDVVIMGSVALMKEKTPLLCVSACKQNALCLNYSANEPELKCKYLWISLHKNNTKSRDETELFCKR